MDGQEPPPAPAVVGDRLFVATENNGARLYEFGSQGKINPTPAAVAPQFNPQMSSPVVVGSRIFCVNSGVECLDADAGLKSLWRTKDRVFCEFGALVATPQRLLVQGRGGELILMGAAAAERRVVSRMPLFAGPERNAELLTFPALAGDRLYVRGERDVVCVELN